MTTSASAAAVVAFVAMFSPAGHQTDTSEPAGTGIELAYLPWAKPNQPSIKGDVLPTGARHPKHKPYVPPPRRWRDALRAPAHLLGPARSALT